MLQPGHLEAEQNDRKVKRSKIKKKRDEKERYSACENHHRSPAEGPRLEK